MARSYPLFLRLAGVRVVVVGAGPVARERVARLAEAGARVRVVAPDAHALAANAPAVDDPRAREFRPSDLDDAWLAIAAATPDVNQAVRDAADARRVFTVAVDDSARCSAFGAASFERGAVTIALSSDGSAPALVALLRRALEALLPPDDLAAWSAVAESARREWRSAGAPFGERRPMLLRALGALYARGEA